MALVNMSVYATKERLSTPDGVHRLLDYAIVVMPGADPSPEWVVIHETTMDQRFELRPGSRSNFQVAVWTNDASVDPGSSWVRCTFRPAHDVGVSQMTSPLSPANTHEALKGLSLGTTTSNKGVDWEDWGMLERQYTGIWWSGNWALQNLGKFEIAVQVGLHYTDGTPPAYFIVDPEMDLDPGVR